MKTLLAGSAQGAPNEPFHRNHRLVETPIGGKRFKLNVQINHPPGTGPFPALVFHHGSTGCGLDPERFDDFFTPELLIRWFVDRGWAVALPARRGRAGSEGVYDEGFYRDRTKGYARKPKRALAGADRALADIDAVTTRIRTWPFVDPNRLLVGGVSRGGAASIAHAGRRPDWYRGVLNFVGGWTGSWNRHHKRINRNVLNRGTAFDKPTLWLYAPDDALYNSRITASYFRNFVKKGGLGTFTDDFPQGPGHGLQMFPELWGPTVEAYLRGRGLPHERSTSGLPFAPDPKSGPAVFLGDWSGHWANVPTALRVEQSDGTSGLSASYTYANDTNTFDAQLHAGTLRIGTRLAFFAAGSDTLIAEYRQGATMLRTLLTRAP